MKRIVLFSPVPLSDKLQSGILIRINQIAKWFSQKGFDVKRADKLDSRLFDRFDIFYILISTKPSSISSQVAAQIPKDKKLIIDLYTPILLEKSLSLSFASPYHWFYHLKNKFIVRTILAKGSHFLVTNHRQKQYWLKTAKSLGTAISPRRISVLPTGAPKLLTVNRQPSNIILWFGGIYPWMNPLPLIEAFSKITSKYPDCKLRILGGFHPKTGYQKLYQKVIHRAQQIIPGDQLEITPWQAQGSLTKYLADVSFAVHLPKLTLEDYYAHRVRLLTLLNYGIPVLTSGSDLISQIFVKNNAGDNVKADAYYLVLKLKSLIRYPQKIKKWRQNAPKIQGIYLKKETDIYNLQQFLR